MKDLYTAAKRLYNEAFPGEDAAFTDALFALGFPRYLEGLSDKGTLCSMLFALPWALVCEEGVREARYLYGVATDARYRGKGYARDLLAAVAAEGLPVFLRPMSDSLFDFYARAGFTPISPYREEQGEAAGDATGIAALSPADYLTARECFLQPPYCRMSEDFLALYKDGGGMLGEAGHFAALYEQEGELVRFKEWLGDTAAAPRAARFLGAARYTLRTPAKEGKPFGVGINVPADAVFLAALD